MWTKQNPYTMATIVRLFQDEKGNWYLDWNYLKPRLAKRLEMDMEKVPSEVQIDK